MAETLTYSQLSTQDIRFGRGTFEVLLADGRAALLNEHNLDDFDRLFHTENSTTNDATTILTLRATSTGTPAAGIGVRLAFDAESADEDPSPVGAIEFTFDDIGSGTEDSTAYLFLRRAGATLSSAYAFRNTGDFQLLLTAALTAGRTITLPDATTTLIGTGTTDTLTSKTLTDPDFNVGGGSGSLGPCGTADVDTTSAATSANTTETDLITFALPSSAFNTSGDVIHVRAWGNTGANTNAKTVRLYFGAVVIASNDITTSPNNNDWVLEGEIVRTGTDTQEMWGGGHVGSTAQTYSHSTGTENDGAAITLKVTGQNGVATANDITGQGLMTKFFNLT